jgi:hypothetical protein
MTQAPDTDDRDKDGDAGGAPSPESREMFAEITALMASVAKALDLTEAETAAALERGEVTLRLDRDANGNPFVAASRGGTTARVYRGAIKRE